MQSGPRLFEIHTEGFRVPVGRKILLASDLTYRCDRALARSAALARQWKAWLVATHVLERATADDLHDAPRVPFWRQPASRDSVAESELRNALCDVWPNSTVVVTRGEPGREIKRLAERHAVDLIVIGPDSSDITGVLSARTRKTLTRQALAPLLVVKARPQQPYTNIVAVTDLSQESVHGIGAALRLFPSARLTVFHAFGMPGRGLSDTSEVASQYRAGAEREVAAFLGEHCSAFPKDARAMRVVAECGELTSLLRDYVRAYKVDLVIVGQRARSTMVELFIGSRINGLLNMLPCDLLIVPPACAG